MAAARCKVSFTDLEGITHCTQVQAESVFEAVALAVSQFRADAMAPCMGPTTEFMVAVEKPEVEHRIRLGHLQKWAETTTREGPAGIIKRDKVKALLAVPAHDTNHNRERRSK